MPRAPRFVVLLALVVSSLVTVRALAAMPLTFSSHHVIDAHATIEEPLARALAAEIEDANVTSVDAMIRFAVDRTDDQLHFGLDHRTTLTFGVRKREGNCVEYARLFATVFNDGAEHRHLGAHAYVIRSDAWLAGLRIPDPAFRDHDWVLVVPASAEAQLRFVDPTLADIGLDWDISTNGEGPLPELPRPRPAKTEPRVVRPEQRVRVTL